MRLDLFLVHRGDASSRERAQELIRSGAVLVDGSICTKNSREIPMEAPPSIVVTSQLKYVGRGGHKLERALEEFRLSLEGKTVLDIGASTGGFTDCALQRGALHVYAVDVGHDQLAEVLRSDPRVSNLEGVHVKDLAEYYNGTPDFICIDVSFLSLTKVLPYLIPFAEGADCVALVKPQFEVRHKKSVIRDQKVHRQVLSDVIHTAQSLGFGVRGITYSPMRGTEGNIEYLLFLRMHTENCSFDVPGIVRSAHDSL